MPTLVMLPGNLSPKEQVWRLEQLATKSALRERWKGRKEREGGEDREERREVERRGREALKPVTAVSPPLKVRSVTWG